MELLLQLHQPSWGQVDVLQHHPPARPNNFCISGHQHKAQLPRVSPTEELDAPAGLDSGVDVFVCFIEAFCRTCGRRTNNRSMPPSSSKQLTAFFPLQTLVPSLPMEMEVICLFCSAARSLTRPLASYPGTEHMSTGVLGLTCRGKIGHRGCENTCRHAGDKKKKCIKSVTLPHCPQYCPGQGAAR